MPLSAREYLGTLHKDQLAPLPDDIVETPKWADEFLGAIRDHRDGQVDDEAQRAAKRFGLSATKDRFRFIWELWQNADDAGASSLRFVIRDRELRVENNGRPLSSRDVYSMCFVASSQKEGDIAQKGQFGIGLLSLMRVCSAPEVHSGSFHFRLDRTYTYPTSIPTDALTDGTRIVAPLTSASDSSKLFDVLVGRAEEEVLLYMSHLRYVEIVEEDTGRTHTIECSPDLTESGARTVRLGSHVWMKYKSTVHPPGDLQREDGEPVPPDVPIVMVRSDSVKPPHRLASFFPTAVEHRLPWRFSAPFEVTNSREALLDSEYNRWLLAEVGAAMVDAALDPKVGDVKEPWHLVPGAEIQEQELRVIYDAAHERLKELEWVPTVVGRRRPELVAIPASHMVRRLIKPLDVPDDDVRSRAWIRLTPNSAGNELLRSLGAIEVCCHELSKTLAAGPARDAMWYLKAAGEALRLADKSEWENQEVFETLRDGTCFKDQRNRPFSLAEANDVEKVVCNTRGEPLAKELARLANRWIVMLHEAYREPRSKREGPSDLRETRKRVDRWLADQADSGWFSYEHSLEAPQFIERFIAERDEGDFDALDVQTHQLLLSLVRDHLRGYRGRYRNADDHLLSIGRRIRVDAYSFAHDGTRVNDRKTIAEVYLGSSYTKSDWTSAASGAPGVWWISSKYKRVLQRKDEDGVVSFLRSLGALDRPRLRPVEINDSHGRHQFARVIHGDATRYPHFPHDQRKFGFYTAHGTRGDHESPDIDHVLSHISTLPESLRRARSGQLYRALERSWESFQSASVATAYAYMSNSETHMGQVPARWLHNLRTAAWMKFADGAYAPPKGRFASTIATRSVLGAKDPELSVWDCTNQELAIALAMQIAVGPIAVVERLRQLQEHDATIPTERAAAYYEALAAAVDLESAGLSPLRTEPLIYSRTSSRKWWTADVCLQKDRSDIFGSDRAYLSAYPKARDLWRFLAIQEEPSLPQLAEWWRVLPERVVSPDAQLLKRLDNSYLRANESCRDADTNEVVPVWTVDGWRQSDSALATDDDELWEALGEVELARWDQQQSSPFAHFCRWSGMTILEDHTQFGAPALEGRARDDDTRALRYAIKSFADELARVDPQLWDRIAPLARRWIDLYVEDVRLLEVPASVALPGASVMNVTVRRRAVLSADRLLVSSLTKVESAEVVRCLLAGTPFSSSESMQIENGIRIRLLEGAPSGVDVVDLFELPDATMAEGQQEFDTEDADVLLGKYASGAAADGTSPSEQPNYQDPEDYVVLSDVTPNGDLPSGGQISAPPVTMKPPASGGGGRRPKRTTQRAVLSVEQQGLELYLRYVLGPAGIQVSDQRLNKGVGADLVCGDGVFRELKTFSGPAPDGIKLTGHERARAATQGLGYELVIVEQLTAAPVISVIPNPLDSLDWYPMGDVRVTGWRDKTAARGFRQVKLGPVTTGSESDGSAAS